MDTQNPMDLTSNAIVSNVIDCVTEPLLLESSNIQHGFFGRGGGVSTGLYQSLNCGQGSDDNPEHVRENRKRILTYLNSGQLVSVHQIHSADCIDVDEVWQDDQKPQVDAMVTDCPGIALGVLTADCCPVLFYGKKEGGVPVIGAAHAGWKGAIGGVLESTLKHMIQKGAKLDTLCAAIGPTISVASYEVGTEFRQTFLDTDVAYAKFFEERDGALYFNLPLFCEHRLLAAGVVRVANVNLDTYANEDQFFSYRRTTHRDEPDYGRQLSVISIV